jgi:hypothetical protein
VRQKSYAKAERLVLAGEDIEQPQARQAGCTPFASLRLASLARLGVSVEDSSEQLHRKNPSVACAEHCVVDNFIICTMGMGVILFSVMNNWMELTRGPLGIPGIPAVTLFWHPFTANRE